MVTVLILNWNGKDLLEKFLPSVMATSYKEVEILVADNGSTDDSVAFLREKYPTIRIIQHEKNHGFTGGNNLAIPAIESPYVALLNSDVEVTPDWLQPLVEQMEADPKVASVQPKILAQMQKTHFEYAGAAGGYIDQFSYPFCRGRLFDKAEEDTGQYNNAQEIFWASGACCLIRKSVIDEIGLFEERFFAHMEEIDFCWRAKNHGYKIMVAPQSVVYHVGGGTLQKSNPKKTFLNIHNSLAMMYKNLPSHQLFPKIFTRLVLDGVWGAKLLFSGEASHTLAILRAHFTFYRQMGFWQKRRNEIYSTKPKHIPASGYLKKSLVWQYFVKGKKIFSDL